MSLNEDFIGQNLEKQSLFSTKYFFLNLKIYVNLLIPKGICEKKSKKTSTPFVPGCKVFFTSILTLKNNLREVIIRKKKSCEFSQLWS